MTPAKTSRFDGKMPSRQQMLGMAGRIVVTALLPLAVYLAVRRFVASDLAALVIGSGVPVVYVLAMLILRRRLDPIGLLAIAGFCFGLFLVFVTGDNELVFKLRKEIWTGPLGVACLVSVLLRRPLLLVGLRIAAKRNDLVAARVRAPGADRIAAVVTAVVGAILLVHSLVTLVIALNTSTTTFLLVTKPINWIVGLGGMLPLVVWLRRQRRRESPDRTAPEADPPGTSD